MEVEFLGHPGVEADPFGGIERYAQVPPDSTGLHHIRLPPSDSRAMAGMLSGDVVTNPPCNSDDVSRGGMGEGSGTSHTPGHLTKGSEDYLKEFDLEDLQPLRGVELRDTVLYHMQAAAVKFVEVAGESTPGVKSALAHLAYCRAHLQRSIRPR